MLLDTHILLWAAGMPDRLPQEVSSLLSDASTEAVFSVASLWEVTIKNGLARPGFHVDPRTLRRGLLARSYRELDVTGAHVLGVGRLPSIHKDPFDRLLVAQAIEEEVPLITADSVVARYGAPVRLI